MTMPGPLKQQSRGRASALQEQGRNSHFSTVSKPDHCLVLLLVQAMHPPLKQIQVQNDPYKAVTNCMRTTFCYFVWSTLFLFLIFSSFFGHITARSASQTGSACATTRTKQGTNLFVEECHSLNHSSCLLAEGNCTNQGFSSFLSLAVPWEVHILTPW